MVKVNINESVKCVITQHGLRKINENGIELVGTELPNKNTGESVFQIWRFCQVFGPILEMGFDPLIQMNTLILMGD